MNSLTLDRLERTAAHHQVPLLDALLIAANMEGARPVQGYPRSRMQLRPLTSEESWQVILPLDNTRSPFHFVDDKLLLGDDMVAELVRMENDDVVLTYLRAGGRSVTLNTYSRSRCTGCLFCPNVIEDAADDTLTGADELAELLEWLQADNGWSDLSEVDVITVCSGCFHNPAAAISHMSDLRRAADRYGFKGRLHLLSSVLREREDLQRLRDSCGPFHLTLTLECFERRSLLLKDSKASLTLDKSAQILDDCRDLDILGDFTYVAGLDSYESAAAGLCQLAPHVSTFPRIQVYQAHNDYMRNARHRDAESLDYYMNLRKVVEQAYAPTGLAPRSWENYRPLWYSTFAEQPVVGPRV
nr:MULTISPECIES: hypothetical protein [Streptomyces]